MPAAQWTTDEQRAFLWKELVKFKQIGGCEYTNQWPVLFQKWFQRWSEHSIALPGIPLDAALTKQQVNILSNAILQHKKQLCHWMHWHAGAGRSCAANNRTAKFVSKFLKQKKHAKKPCEIYSKLFFKTHVQSAISTGMSIMDINKKVRESFESESTNVKELIMKMTEEQNENAKKRRGGSKNGCDSNTDDDTEKDPDALRT